MASGPVTQPAYIVSRERLTLTLAFPFLLLYGASFLAWPWRALDLPGVFGSLTPPSIVLLAAAVSGSMYAIRRRLPLGMITWVPAGQGAILLLGVGFVPPGADETLALAVTFIILALVYLLALGLAVAIAGHGIRLAIAFIAFFVMAQATRFPIFEVHAAEPISGAPFLTLAAAARSAIEIAVLVWLATRLVADDSMDSKRAAWYIVALALGHGLIAGWEDPVLQGNLSFLQVMEQVVRWLIPASIQLGMVTVLARMRSSWSREPSADASTPAPDAANPAPHDSPASHATGPAPHSSSSRTTNPAESSPSAGSHPANTTSTSRRPGRPTPRKPRHR